MQLCAMVIWPGLGPSVLDSTIVVLNTFGAEIIFFTNQDYEAAFCIIQLRESGEFTMHFIWWKVILFLYIRVIG